MKKFWVATEDAGTYEVSEFDQATEAQALHLMDDYRVDPSNPTRIRVQDVEDGQHVVYDGVIYKGGFGFNLWVTRKYLEM